MAIYLLATTDVLTFPFFGSRCADPIALLLAASIGRYAFRALQDVYLHEHFKKWWILSLHHTVSIVCLATMVIFGENLLLGVVGVLVEANSICYDTLWILKFCEIPTHTRLRTTVASLSFALLVLLRILLPILFSIYACVKQSPLSMHPAPLATLFLAGVFFLAMNLWYAFISFRKLKKALDGQKVKEMEVIIESKVPNFPNLTRSTRNIFPKNNPLEDAFAQKNIMTPFLGGAPLRYKNVVDCDPCKADKLPFNMILMTHSEAIDLNCSRVPKCEPARQEGNVDPTAAQGSVTVISSFGDPADRTRPEEVQFVDIPLSPVEIDV